MLRQLFQLESRAKVCRNSFHESIRAFPCGVFYEANYQKGKLVEGYWLDLGGFLKKLRRVGERWKAEFPQSSS